MRDAVQNPWETNEPGLGLGRDPQRTPMQWDETPRAGFTEATPWLPLSTDHRERNVERMRLDPHSILALYRELIAIRSRSPALRRGDFRLLSAGRTTILFERSDDPERVLVALNFGQDHEIVDLPPNGAHSCLISTFLDRWNAGRISEVSLRPGEGVLLRSTRQ
jgi:alpha-glucosidase